MADKIFLEMAEEEVVTDGTLIVSEGIGSCVVVCLRDSENGVSGAAHVVLPNGEDEESEKYADVLMRNLFADIRANGGNKQNLEAKIFGGAELFDFSGHIGPKNISSVEQILEDNEIDILARDTGGSEGREVKLYPGSWQVEVSKPFGECKSY